MGSYECTAERFLKDVDRHCMTIVKDEGLYRHIQFRNPETSNHWFDILTWKGCLCINGDMGTYVFARIEDMFEFFTNPARELRINTGYWHEKILSADRHLGVKKFSVDKFHDYIKEEFDEQTEGLSTEEKDELWDDLQYQISGESEYECFESLREFNDDRLDFTDFYHHDFKEYVYQYVWCCYAIVWAIHRYFVYKDEVERMVNDVKNSVQNINIKEGDNAKNKTGCTNKGRRKKD